MGTVDEKIELARQVLAQAESSTSTESAAHAGSDLS
jgi:hypothetical protein